MTLSYNEIVPKKKILSEGSILECDIPSRYVREHVKIIRIFSIIGYYEGKRLV